MKTNIQKPANHHTFQQRKELPKHLKPASPTNLASQHHSQHIKAISLEFLATNVDANLKQWFLGVMHLTCYDF